VTTSEEGSATVELAVLAPVMVLLILLVVLAGRLVLAHQEIDAAAADAARAASIATSADAATSAATQAATQDIAGDGLNCDALSAAVDTSDFVPGGTVTVELTCRASLAGLSSLRLPGSETLTSSSSAPIDLYRGVSS